MKNIFSNKSYLPFLFIFPLLRNADISYLLVFFSLISLFNIIKNKFCIKKLDAFISLIPILILFFSALYKIPNKIDFSYYQSIFFYPMILIAFIQFEKFDKKLINKTLKVFTLSVFLLCIITLGYIIAKYDISYVLASNLNGSNFRILVEQIPYFGNSPIYLSLYILIANIVLIENYSIKSPKVIIGIIFFSLIIFILFSKTQIFIFLIYIIYKIYEYLNSKSFKIKFFFFIMFFVVIFLIFKNTPFIYNRIYEMYLFSKMPEGLSSSSSSIRLAIMDCTFKIISSNQIFGVGLLNVKNILNTCLASFNAASFKNDVFFTHNQFLFYFISSGLIGGVIFISFIIYSLKKIFCRNRTLFIILSVIVASMLTEDIFLRQKGITIFATFLFLGYNGVKHV